MKLTLLLDNFMRLFDDQYFLFLVSLMVFTLMMFYFVMVSNREVINKKSNAQMLFFSLLMFLIMAFVGFLIIAGEIFINTSNSKLIQFFVSYFDNSLVTDVILFLINLFFFGFVCNLLYKKRRQYKAHKKTDFRIQTNERFKKSIKDEDMRMENIKRIYKIENGKKEYLENYKVPKFTFIKKDELTYFQKELLIYLRQITGDRKIQKKIYEFEILRLIEITIEKRLDLKIGQFRSIAQTEKDDEILGAIYNMREKNMTNEGYSYYKQYLLTKQYTA